MIRSKKIVSAPTRRVWQYTFHRLRAILYYRDLYQLHLRAWKRRLFEQQDRKPGPTILVVHPIGTPKLKRHLNDYEVVAEILRHAFGGGHILTLSCNQAVLACDARGDTSGVIESFYPKQQWSQSCQGCIQWRQARTALFTDGDGSIRDIITPEDRIWIEQEIEKLGSRISLQELVEYEIGGISIGKSCWESIQRYFYLGKAETISLGAETVTGQFLRSGLIYYLAAKRIYEEYSVDLVLTNEFGYLIWGAFSDVALAQRIPMIGIRRGYKGYHKMVMWGIIDNKDLFRLTLPPVSADYLAVMQDEEMSAQYAEEGRMIIEQLDKPHGYQRETLLQQYGLDPNKKTVTIFTHLCWDSTLRYGEFIFPTFDDWLTFTYQKAVQKSEFNWLFRIHPSEARLPKNEHVGGMYELLQALHTQGPCPHIAIMPPTTHLTAGDTAYCTDVAITGSGTITFQMVSLNVPVIVVNYGRHGSYGFTIDCHSPEEYEKYLDRIETIRPPTTEEKKRARVYARMFWGEDYLDVSSVYGDKENLEDLFVNRGRLRQFVKSEVVRNYLQNSNLAPVIEKVRSRVPDN